MTGGGINGRDKQGQSSGSHVQAWGPTLSLSTLTSGDAGVLSVCFLGSVFSSVSSLEPSEEPSDISYFYWPQVLSPF